MSKLPLSKLLFFISLFCTVILQAQTEADTTKLSEVKLFTTSAADSFQNSANSVSVITSRDLNQSDGVILTASLNKVPGVTMQQGALNTNRITIRGIGSRSQFSTNRIKAYFENIPLTNGEGETIIEDIDMETIGSVTVLKGSNNSRYGSGLGGVLLLKGNDEMGKNSYVKTATVLGSFNLWKQTVAVGLASDNSTLSINYNYLQNEGFRDNSDYERHSVNIMGTHQFNDSNKLSFIAIFTDLKAFIPSSINKTDFINNPNVAAANWKAAQGFESYDKLLLGLNYDIDISSNLSLSTSIYGNLKDAYEPRPFDILEDKTGSFGLRSVLNYNWNVWSQPSQWTIGGEFLSEDYTFSLIENLYQSQPGNGSIEGDTFAKINQKRHYVSFFLEQTTQIKSKLFLETGVSFNHTNYNLKDIFETARNRKRQRYSFDNVLSPRLGVSYQFAPHQNLFSAISKGFSVPSVAETLTPDGQINTDLKPESGWSYEVGLKSNLFQNKLSAEITLYSTQICNLLVARRIAEDQFVGINAGESSHKGAEISLKYKGRLSDRVEFNPYFTGSFNQFRFKEFIDGDTDYSGNKLTGAPNYQWQTGIDVQTSFGMSINFSVLNVGEIPLNDANTLFSDAYTLSNFKAIYDFTLLKHIKTQVATGINNLFDTNYAASILPNAASFGNALPRYYYPGAPINFYGHVRLFYEF